MRKAASLLVVALTLSLMVAAQNTNSTAPGQQSPATSSPSTGNNPNPSDTARPQSSMPPDQSAAQASQSQSTTTTNQNTTNSNAAQSNSPQQSNAQDNSQNGGFGNRNAEPAGGPHIATGTEIRATLDTPLSTKTSKQGDQFTATVVEPVRTADGAIAIPAGAKIQGEVSESEQGKTLPSIRGKGRLNLRFRDVQLPDGTSLPLAATLISVNEAKGGSAGKTDNEGEIQSGTNGKTAAKNVGIGAGIGTVAGLIFGSALKGLAIGALAGGGYVLAQNGKDVNLPAQTGMRLRLDRNVSVPASAVQRQ